MEVIGAIATVMGYLRNVVGLIVKNNGRLDDLAIGLSSMRDYLELLTDQTKELQLSPRMQLRLQELAFDIEDFIDDLSVPGPLGSFVLTAIGADNRPGYIQQTSYFKNRIKNLKEELSNNTVSTPAEGSSTPAGGSPITYAQEVDLVGIEGPKKEIVELLSPRVDPHRGRLGVISIVGCSGSGKTALARALYEDDDLAKDFDYKAWVVASDPSSADILNKILRQVVPASPPKSISEALQQFRNKILRWLRLPASTPGSTSEALQQFINKILRRWNISQASEHFLKDKRYLVFLDDVQPGAPWEDINEAFRENTKDSRIIVTTSVPSVARACSSGSYMYTMQHLNQQNSRTLFRVKFRKGIGCPMENEHVLTDENVNVIINKCDGLPIALIAAAKCAHMKGADQTEKDFKQVSRELCECMASSESEFQLKKRNKGNEIVELRRALVKPYENLLDSGYQDCLLYVSIIPSGHVINRKSLVRRLIAEGLFAGDRRTDIFECLRILMDQLMIEPVPIRNYYNAAKVCRVSSIMLEFTIQKALSRNFVSLIQKGQLKNNKAGKLRRLTVQSNSDEGNTELDLSEQDLSVLRSIAIFNNSGIQNLKKCRLVRVLDIEGCPRLTQEVLENIRKLLFLKYLSLRNTGIRELPENLKELMSLEMVDTRDTRGTRDNQNTVVIKLPVEVLMLPRLAYLFGMFELTNVHSNDRKELTKFLEERSQLHTFGGIAVHETKGLEIVLLVVQYTRWLKKVKVWYRNTLSSTACTGLVTTSTSAVADTHTPEPSHSGRKRRFQIFSTQKPIAQEPFPCVNRLAETLKKRSVGLESVTVDFNGVPNSFLDFIQNNGTISSIKLRRGQGSLPGPDKVGKSLGQVRSLKKLHLFSTGLKSNELVALQYLKCLQYLKLAEDGRPGLWDSVFHVQVGGFISLIWLCFESSKSKPPPLKIDEGVKTPLASLLLLCKDSHPRVEGISHLANLNEVILHKEVSTEIVNAWKEEAKKHINRPYVEKQQV